MAQRSLQWPKLIGSFVGLEALSIFICQAQYLFWRSDSSGWPSAGTTWAWLILGTSVSMLAFFLFRAHNWARLAVIILGISLCALLLRDTIVAEMSWGEMLQRPSRAGRELWLLQVESALDAVGTKLPLIALVVFIIGVLCHRDVAAAFKPPRNT